MTVCVAAIAAESRAIVMIADKMITRGDMVSDTSICKMSRIGQTPWCAMIAGVIATADEVLMRTAIELQKSPKDVEEEYSMMKVVGRVYKEVYQEHLAAEVLIPKLLTRETALDRPNTLLPLPQKLTEEIDEDRKRFENRWGCQLLICGFDVRGNPKIFEVFQPEHAASETRQGYAAIGIGADAATGRLMWHESDCDDALERVIWETFDAKVQAEIMRGVGFGWDGFVMLKSNPLKAESIPDELQEIMDKAMRKMLRSPFETGEPDADETPPDDWQDQLRQFANTLIPSELTFC